ncbi:MAG TPA: hypothetical protein VF698_01605 [Thermoanaerobaculia bacterium]|jgi:hypothetical protein
MFRAPLALSLALSLLVATPAFAAVSLHVGAETVLADPAPLSYALAVGGETPVLAWSEPAFGTARILVAPVERLERAVELPLRTPGAMAGQPAILFDRDGYIVTWVETIAGVQTAVALRLDRDLHPLTVLPVALTSAPASRQLERPRIVHADGSPAIAWNYVLVRDDGAALPYDYAAGAVPVTITANNVRVLVLQNAIQPARCNFFPPIFCTPAQVALDARVFHGGVFLIPLTLAARQAAPWAEVTAAAGRDGFLAVWRDATGPIEAVQIANNGAAGQRIVLGNGSEATDLAAAGDGSLFVVLWNEVTGPLARGLVLRAITSRGVSEPVALGRDLSAAQLVPLGGERMLLLYRRGTQLVARAIAEPARVRVTR